MIQKSQAWQLITACKFVQSRDFHSIKLRREILCKRLILTSHAVKLTLLKRKYKVPLSITRNWDNLDAVFSRRILENVPDYYNGVVFFRHERSTFLFICSTTSNFNNFKPQQLQPQKRVQNEKKKQNRRPQPRKHTLAPLFFSTFFEVFWIAPEGPPSFVSIFCNTMDVKKSQRVPPFTFFGTVTLFKNLIKNFFWEIFSCLQRVPLQFFFKFLATSWSFTKPEGSPF